MNLFTFIKGTGHYLPETKLTNADLMKMVDTTDEWIVERTGIRVRHLAAPSQNTSDMAAYASRAALAAANVDASDIQTIICATTTADAIFPSAACMVQEKIGAKNAFAFDVSAACSGFIYAMTLADSLIKTGQAKNVLVIGAELLSRVTNYKDRETCILFGDGAGAVVVSEREVAGRIPFSSQLSSDGSLGGLLMLKSERSTDFANQSETNPAFFIEMKGREVFKNAVRAMTSTSLAALEKAGVPASAVTRFIPHQANQRILAMVASNLGIGEDRIVNTIAATGNTSSASIPIALSQAIQAGSLNRGDTILATAFGAGLTAGALVLEY